MGSVYKLRFKKKGEIKMNKSLATINPFYDIFDDMFNSFGTVTPNETKTVIPTDIYRIKNDNGEFTSLCLDFAVSGLDINNINMWLDDNILIIKYEKQKDTEDKKEYTQKQISKKSWEIKYRLVGNKLNIDNIDATYNSGILSLKIPILKEEQTMKKVPLKILEEPVKQQLKAA